MSSPVQTRAAAQERAVRSFLTGLGLDVAIAVAAAVLTWLPTADVVTHTAWIVLAATVVKSILQAVATYVLRLKLTPATEVDGAFDISSLPLDAAVSAGAEQGTRLGALRDRTDEA